MLYNDEFLCLQYEIVLRTHEYLINDNEEIDSYLLHNFYTGNLLLIIKLIIFFSLEFMRVIIKENFAAIVFITTLSIQIDIV